MKYTNIKKLLIKFFGGGLINFPTRFLRWVIIEGDSDGDDGEDDGGDEGDTEYVFFCSLDIQPKGYLTNMDGDNYSSIKNINTYRFKDNSSTWMLYDKNDILSLNIGVTEQELDNLQIAENVEFGDYNVDTTNETNYISKEVDEHDFAYKVCLYCCGYHTPEIHGLGFDHSFSHIRIYKIEENYFFLDSAFS